MSNYTTKSDLKGGTGVDTSKISKEVDFAILKSDIGDSDIDKLKTVLVSLSKLSDVVKNEVIKKACI